MTRLDCPQVEEILHADGAATAEPGVAAHLGACTSCTRLAASLAALDRELACAFTPAPADAASWQDVLRRAEVAAAPRPHASARRLIAFSSLAAALALPWLVLHLVNGPAARVAALHARLEALHRTHETTENPFTEGVRSRDPDPETENPFRQETDE